MARLEIYRRADQKWAWRLKADNGFIVASDASQGYENKDDAKLMGSAVKDGRYASAVVVEV